MELDSIVMESIKLMENEFYNNKFYFSYSSLNKLLWSPQTFYQIYVLGNREEKMESYLVNGKVIHCLLLEPEKFNDLFIISPSSLPTGNTKVVIDSVYRHHLELKANGDQRVELVEFSQAILDILKDMNLHQSLKTDAQRLDKILTPESISYWEFLKTRSDKLLIDEETYNYCKNAVDIVSTNNKITKLIGKGVTEFDFCDVYNELYLETNINDKKFGIKGIIDNIVINHNEKIIYINDIKTTSKDLKDFKESIDFYNYWLQAAIYATLVGKKYMDLIDKGYSLKFHFIVIDRLLQSYAFVVSNKTMEDWFNKFLEVIEKADWHYNNKNYELPFEFAIDSIIL
jgi:hypothetical protein